MSMCDTPLFERVQAPIDLEERLNREEMKQGNYREKKGGEIEKKKTNDIFP